MQCTRCRFFIYAQLCLGMEKKDEKLVARVSGTVLFEKRKERFRIDRRFSQEKFAEKCGLHRTTISAFERGVLEPKLSTIIQIAKALEISPGEFVDEVTRRVEASQG